MYISDNKQNITKYKPNQLKHEQINERCPFLRCFMYSRYQGNRSVSAVKAPPADQWWKI